MFRLTIKTDNAAFQPDNPGGYGNDDEAEIARARNDEVARILREIARAIEQGTRGAPIHDVNGIKCGRFDFTERD